MKMDIIAGSGNDEFYTPEYAIRPLLKYIPKGKIVWCPFDSTQSNFVKLLSEHGCIVLPSHLLLGQDFFQYEPDQYDYIISNPPYSLKEEVFNRLFKIGKPFAMLVGVVGLFESQRRFNLFKYNKFEIMYFNKRISYFKNYDDPKPSLNPPFSSVYVCKDILPERIIFEVIDK
jgi:hypothetical protein